MKKIIKITKKTGLIVLGIILGTSVSVLAATWQGTGWIRDGSIIDAQKLKADLDYLYENAGSGCSLSVQSGWEDEVTFSGPAWSKTSGSSSDGAWTDWVRTGKGNSSKSIMTRFKIDC